MSAAGLVRPPEVSRRALRFQKEPQHIAAFGAQISHMVGVSLHGVVPSGALRISGMGSDAVAVATSSRCSRTALSISAMT